MVVKIDSCRFQTGSCSLLCSQHEQHCLSYFQGFTLLSIPNIIHPSVVVSGNLVFGVVFSCLSFSVSFLFNVSLGGLHDSRFCCKISVGARIMLNDSHTPKNNPTIETTYSWVTMVITVLTRQKINKDKNNMFNLLIYSV